MVLRVANNILGYVLATPPGPSMRPEYMSWAARSRPQL